MVLTTLRRFLYALFGGLLLTYHVDAKILDGGVDPANLGKGDWIYVLSTATSQFGGVDNLMTYLKNKGMEHVIVKAGDGADDYYYPSGNLQFSTTLVNAAHNAGLKIFGYTRSYGTDVAGEIALAGRVYGRGADGFVIDAEIEWETRNLADNFNKALQLAGGIKTNYPNKFLGHSPFVYISYHTSFPYKEFGLHCDAVMPQAYWNEISLVSCSPTQMAADLSSQWRNWQNGLTGNWTNSIKPICPVGSAWENTSTCPVSGADIIAFVNALKTDANPATKGGYHGVNYWRVELHSQDMWNGIGSASIATAPVILTQPKGITVTNVNPTNVTFTVGAAGGNPLKYQWRIGGVNIVGATNGSYTISNVQFTNAGSYSVVITNALGSTNSANATLTVKAPPKITTQPLGQTVVVSNAAAFTVIANGTTPLSYQWKFNGTNISGATASTYTRSNVALTNAGNYSVLITNAFGSITSAAANLIVVSSASAPVITLQPQSKTAIAGMTAMFSVSATGTSPFFYQWKLNGTNLAAGTTSLYTITNAQPANAGSYSVVVSNSAGADTSVSATLAVHYALSLNISGDGTVTKSPSAASYAPGTVVTLTPGTFFTAWSGAATGSASPLSVTMTTNKSITATFTAVNVIVESRDADGTAPPTTVYTDVGFSNSSLKSSAPPLSGSTNQGSRYAASGTPSFTVKPVLPHAGGKYEVEVTHGSASSISTDIIVTNSVTGGSMSASSTTAFRKAESANAWASAGELTLNAGVTNPTMKFAYASGTLNSSTGRFYSDAVRFIHLPLPVITTQPVSQTNLPGVNVVFAVEASGATTYQWKFNGTNLAGGTLSAYTRTNAQSSHVGNYSVVIGNANGSVTSSNAAFVLNVVPTISTGPQNQTVNQGSDATFSVAATGSATLTYQWRFLGGNIIDATNSVYVRSNTQPNDEGSYSVVVRNSAGSVLSSEAVLVVRTPPVIIEQPVDETVNPGESASFSVAASGSGPLSYQWLLNDAPIGGATNTTYAIASAQQQHEGFYSVVVSNVAGAVQSDEALLSINAAPEIVTQPESQSVDEASPVTFLVEVNGTAPFSYQWLFNNTPIASGTDSVLVISEAMTNDAGTYTVTVSNMVGTATSQGAVLSVTTMRMMQPVVLSNQTIQISFSTKPNSTNVVEVSTNLGSWQPVSTNFNTNGVETYLDTNTNAGRRFYRALRVP